MPEPQTIDDILGPKPAETIDDILGPAPIRPPPSKPGSPAIAAAYPGASTTQIAKASTEATTAPDLKTRIEIRDAEQMAAGKYNPANALAQRADVGSQIGGIGDPREPLNVAAAMTTGLLPEASPQSEQILRNTYGQVGGGALAGAQNFGAAMSSPSNLALVGGIGAAPKIVGKLAAVVFSSDMLSNVYRQSPELAEMLGAGQWGDAAKLATQMGLTSVAAIAAAKHASGMDEAKPAKAPPTPPDVDVPNQAEVKAKLATPPGASEALKKKIQVQTAIQETQERVQKGIATVKEQESLDPLKGGPDWTAFGLPEEEIEKIKSGPDISDEVQAALNASRDARSGVPVKTPAGDTVLPNTRVDATPLGQALEQGAKEKVARMGADPEDPQSVANVIADAKGIERPTVTIDPALAVSQTEGDHISLPVDATTTAVIHEMEHVGEKAGLNPPPPEGDQTTTAAQFMFAPEPPRSQVLAEKALPGYSDWAEQPAGLDYKPEFVKALGDKLAAIRDVVSPTTGVSDKVMDIMGKARGSELKADFMMAHDKILKTVEQKFGSLPPQENVAFIDRMKANLPQPTPELQAIATHFKEMEDAMYERADALKKLTYKGNKEAGYSDDPEAEGHFRAVWDGRWTGGAPGVGRYEKFSPDIMNSKPGGAQGFYKQASGLNAQQLIDAGFVPRTWNAGQMWKMGYAEKARFVGFGEATKAAFDNDAIVKVARGTDPPAGFEPISDPKFTRFFDAMKASDRFPQEAVEHGDYYADPQLKNLLENYYSKNFVRQFGPTATVLALKNFTTAQELLIALPHLLNTTMITSAHEMAVGMSELWNQGVRGADVENIAPLEFKIGDETTTVTGRKAAIARGAFKVMEGMVPAISSGRYVEKSGRLYRILTTPEELLERSDAQYLADNPYVKRATAVIFESGAHPTWDETHTGSSMQIAKDEFTNNNNARGVAALLGAGAELVGRVTGTKAIFAAISRQKFLAYIETFGQLAAKNADKLADGTMNDEKIGRMAWDHVDNLYGMIDYGRTWFWNRTFAGATQMLVRAPGWTIGSLKAAGTGAKVGAEDLMSPLKLIGSGDEDLNLKNATPALDPRTAFPIAMLLPVAAAATIYQIARTGKAPDEPLDFVYPKAGGVNDRGHPNRTGMFGYPKEWMNWEREPGKTATNKISGIFGRVGESMHNRDFYGQQVYDPTASQGAKILAGTGHVLLPSPFAYAGVKETLRRDEGKPTPEQVQDIVMTLVGNRPAPQSLENTPAEDVMDKILSAKKSEEGVPEDVFQNRQQMRLWVSKIRDKGDEAKQGVINDILTAGGGPRLVAGVMKRAQMPPEQSLFSMLNLKEANQVWDHATPEEKKRWLPLFAQKIQRADPMKSNFPAEVMKLKTEASAKIAPMANPE